MIDKKALKERFKNMKPDMGVFAYICKPTGKAYIGCGQNLKGDMNSITFQLNLGSFNQNTNLQVDWKEHGQNEFEITVLETLEYDRDESKTDYAQDLEQLREMVAEKFDFWERIG